MNNTLNFITLHDSVDVVELVCKTSGKNTQNLFFGSTSEGNNLSILNKMAYLSTYQRFPKKKKMFSVLIINFVFLQAGIIVLKSETTKENQTK